MAKKRDRRVKVDCSNCSTSQVVVGQSNNEGAEDVLIEHQQWARKDGKMCCPSCYRDTNNRGRYNQNKDFAYTVVHGNGKT